MVFIAKNKIRMHDTDMAGILYFARQFRLVHDAMEDFFEENGITFDQVAKNKEFMFVIVHAEADYKVSLRVADSIEVHLSISHIGNSSFTISYQIYKTNGPKTLTGTAKTIHVCINPKTRTKVPIPSPLKKILSQNS